ncbi:MAG: SPASM domain-containing protein, partial [Sedimentisphaerales bacterium]|nr:SPASM domain-containing protein [Sedimentisphaerales bacterium]
YLLGNITQTPLVEMVNGAKQIAFGQTKQSTLPGYCRQCRYRFTCHGECPKNRILRTPDGEPGLNWLCSGLKAFFEHTEPAMRKMADLLKRGHYADEIMTSAVKEIPVASRQET